MKRLIIGAILITLLTIPLSAQFSYTITGAKTQGNSLVVSFIVMKDRAAYDAAVAAVKAATVAVASAEATLASATTTLAEKEAALAAARAAFAADPTDQNAAALRVAANAVKTATTAKDQAEVALKTAQAALVTANANVVPSFAAQVELTMDEVIANRATLMAFVKSKIEGLARTNIQSLSLEEAAKAVQTITVDVQPPPQ